MPQSRLIDVNTSAIKRRNEISAGLDSKNYDKVFGALNAFNALLPEADEPDGRQKYRVVISDQLYEQFTKHEVFINCTECKEEFNFDKIKVFDLQPMVFETIITGQKKNKAWFCPKCKVCCKLVDSDMTETVPKEPYYIRVVPRPPRRRDGLHDHSSYHRRIVQWAWTFVGELENSIAQFRDDNWQRKEEFSDDDIIDGEEEE